MPRTYEELAQETKRWKDLLAANPLHDFPISTLHIYNDSTDVYELLTTHVKEWVERELGFFYERQSGKLERLPDSKRTQESADFEDMLDQYITYPKENWFSAALKGNKRGRDAIPHFDPYYKTIVDNKIEDFREQVVSTFMPAYRALEESFSKRPFWQWFTNHAQYTAERDSLKVMKNLLKSMLRTDNKGLKAILADNKKKVSAEAVENATVEPTKMLDVSTRQQPEKNEEKEINYQDLLANNPEELYKVIDQKHKEEEEKERLFEEEKKKALEESKPKEEIKPKEETKAASVVDLFTDDEKVDAVRDYLLENDDEMRKVYDEIDRKVDELFDPDSSSINGNKIALKNLIITKDTALRSTVEEFEKKVMATFERWTVHDELDDKYPGLAAEDEEAFEKLVDEELARRAAEKNKPEKLNLEDEFKENKDIPKSEMIKESPAAEKSLEV